MLIDIHAHAHRRRTVFPDAGIDYPTAAELVAMMDDLGIDKAVMLSRMVRRAAGCTCRRRKCSKCAENTRGGSYRS